MRHALSRRRTVFGAAAVLATAGAVVLVSTPAVQAVPTPTPAINRSFKDPRIVESSGLARSYLKKGVLWTLNDSGDTARVFSIGPGGYTRAVFSFRGAEAHDWEGMATAKRHGISYLFTGDIGDNAQKRSTITVYRIREPKPSAKGGSRTPVTWTFKYPDGAHNAETLLVRPGSLRIYIATKVGSGNGAVYRAPAHPSTKHVNVLTKIKAGPVPALASDGTFLDKYRFVIRAYPKAYLYSSFQDKTPTVFKLPDSGEGLARGWAHDLYTSVEGKYTPIWRVPLP